MPPPPTERRSFYQDYQTAKWLMQFPALSLIVLYRRDLGYRLLNPANLLAVNGLLFVIGVLAQPGNEDASPIFLSIFAVLSFTCGMVQRVLRWLQLDTAARQHSEYIGTSPLAFRWLPAFLLNKRRIERFGDSFVWLAVGFAFYQVSHALGCYLVFASFCLRAFEFQVHCRERERDLDITDSLIVAEQHSRTAERFEDSPGTGSPRSTGAVPTGLSADIQANLKRRKSATPPPN
jgi:hypothetical protein